VNQIAPEHVYSPSLSRVSSPGGELSKGDQSLNGVRAVNKPSPMNTFPTIVVRLSILFTFSFITLILSILAGLRLGNSLLHPSPFSAYEAVWPGQSIASLSEYAQQTIPDRLPCLTDVSPRREYPGLEVRVAAGAYNVLGQAIKCTAYPKDGMFRVISLTIESDRIRQLEFYSEVLSEDVLLLYWGMPDSITPSGNPQIVWSTPN
jgi:hypothetical protein